ncbi:DUF72 domain-containing protein [Ancylobacter polymorphus]|uniref:DUF72 domain-containing protein n=1 Tax=Ancylobacter polymorphus TaxID=223390 RepID=A0A9E7D3Z0_9HYPH|nr:DUF72 domain-containing protein [Ancylobacter polymorphus]UOK71302.1 DUF72 domain-containing protein [Ancylobacter polymorphus]
MSETGAPEEPSTGQSRRRAAIRIGVSGWTYAPWRGHFYPKGLTQARELSYAARQFPTLEINGTFYGLQRPEVFERWAQSTPDAFVFAVKGSRFITHTKRLRDVRLPLANFLASGLLNLGVKMGPLLWQLPPTLRFDPALIGEFLALLPKDTEAAARLAGQHDARVDGRAAVDIDFSRPLRHAVEIRHESFRTSAFVDLLREHGVALVCADTVKWPRLMDLTADFAYCRLHGSTELYRSRYPDDELALWAQRIGAWAEGKEMPDGDFAGAPTLDRRRREVFVFFDNTDKRHAPEDARRLMEMLDLRWEAGEEPAG